VVVAPVQVEEVDDVPQPRPVDQVPDRPAEDESRPTGAAPGRGGTRCRRAPPIASTSRKSTRVDPAVIEVRRRLRRPVFRTCTRPKKPGTTSRSSNGGRLRTARPCSPGRPHEKERRDDRHRKFPQQGHRHGVTSSRPRTAGTAGDPASVPTSGAWFQHLRTSPRAFCTATFSPG